MNLAKPLLFTTADADVTFMGEPAYKIAVACGKFVKAIHGAVVFLDTRAGVDHTSYAFITPVWRNSVKKETLPRVRTAMKQTVQIEGLVMLRICLEDLCT